MRESGCKISRVVLLAVALLLVALRVAPHHHCGYSCGMPVAFSSVHFGFEDCGGCSHEHSGGCDDGHSAVLCYDASLFYFRSTSTGCILEKILQPSLPEHVAILDSTLPDTCLSQQAFVDGDVPDILDVVPVMPAMRAPPVIFL